MQVVHLATTQQLTQQCLLDRALVLLHDEGAYRQAARWRRGDDRQVAHARHRHVQRTRDRRGGEGEDVHLAAQGLELFLLTHAKAVLFVDDGQAQVLEAHIVLQQLVGADEDVDLAFGQLGGGVGHFLGRLEAAHHLHGHRPVGKAVAEAVVVLLGEQGGGHQYGHLAAAVHGDERRAHGHFGLAEADIAAHQAVHRLGRQHVGAHGFDGSLLVRGFLEREAGAEGGVVGGRVGKCIALARGAAGIDVEQFGGHVAHLFGGLALGLLPGLRAKPVQRCQCIVAAGVAGDQVQVGHRHVQFGALGVFQGEEFGGLAVDFQGGQAQVAAHAMVDVHHRRAFAQLGQVLDHRVVGGFAALVAAPALHDPLAEQRAFGHQCNGWVVQQQPFVQRGDGDCQPFAAGDEVGPAVDGVRAQFQPFEQLQQHFAAACRFGGEQNPAGELVEEIGQFGQGLVGLGLDCQVGKGARREALAAHAGGEVFGADHYPWPLLEPGKAVFNRQEQLGRRQQRPAQVATAVFITPAHVVPEVFGGLFHAGQREHLGVGRQVVEQGRGFFEEQWQVVLDAGGDDAAGQVLEDRAAAEIDIEAFAEARLEAGHFLFLHRELARRQQAHRIHLVDRTLGLGVEGAQRLDLVIEQVDAVGQLAAHREQVDQRAAHGEFAMLVDGVDAAIATGLQAQAHLLHVDGLAHVQHQAAAQQEAGRRQAVQGGGDRHHEDAVAQLRQAVEAGDALGNDVLVRREQVVGQGFPIGERQHRQVRGKEAKLLFQTIGSLAVGSQQQSEAARAAGGFGDGQAEGGTG